MNDQAKKIVDLISVTMDIVDLISVEDALLSTESSCFPPEINAIRTKLLDQEDLSPEEFALWYKEIERNASK